MCADFNDDGILNQSNTLDDKGNAVDYADNASFGSGSLTFQGDSAGDFFSDNTGVTCFVAGTLINTPKGTVPIEALRPGDTVTLADGRSDTVLWCASSHVPERAQAKDKRQRPVIIPKGLFCAERDIAVSQQHGIAGHTVHASLTGFLVPAGILQRHWPDVRRGPVQPNLVYVHVLLRTHGLLCTHGLVSESFFPGPIALDTLSPQALANLLDVVPALQYHSAERA